MSMRTWTQEGIGFSIEECDEYKVAAFIAENAGAVTEAGILKGWGADRLRKELVGLTQGFPDGDEADREDIREWLDEYIGDGMQTYGANAVAAAINAKEGTAMFAGCSGQEDCGTEASVIYEAGYPYQMTERDKALTREGIEGILRKYADALGLKDGGRIGDLELEYFG